MSNYHFFGLGFFAGGVFASVVSVAVNVTILNILQNLAGA